MIPHGAPPHPLVRGGVTMDRYPSIGSAGTRISAEAPHAVLALLHLFEGLIVHLAAIGCAGGAGVLLGSFIGHLGPILLDELDHVCVGEVERVAIRTGSPALLGFLPLLTDDFSGHGIPPLCTQGAV